MRTCTLWLLLAALSSGRAGGVRITELNVPPVALEGDNVHLRCNYEDEGGSSLYTLKWYKDNQEFFRHLPGRGPREGDAPCRDNHIYDVDGVSVDCWASTERDVKLQGVTRATSGDYQCEVIGEHPTFRKEARKARLTVFSEALMKPLVLGAKDSYSPQDYVALNCSSLNTEYVPKLTWLINGQPANKSLVRDVDHRTEGLVFEAREEDFQRGEISVSCVTSLGREHTMVAHLKLQNRHGLSVKSYFSNTGQRGGEGTAPLAGLLLVLHLLRPLIPHAH